MGISMLLNFKTKNFKSFAEEANFSMIPTPKQKGLDYSICTESTGGTTIKGLCASVIYGPNASGKTNLISAMDVLRSIILRGNIKNADELASPNLAANNLELMPNRNLPNETPVDFAIEFTDVGMLIQYELSIEIGGFMNGYAARHIRREALFVNGDVVFERQGGLKIGSLKTISSYVKESKKSSRIEFAKEGLNDEELFLTSGFKVLFSPSLANIVVDWFASKFMVICMANNMRLIKQFSESDKNSIYIEKTTNDAAKIFGINSNAIGYVVDGEDTKLCSFFGDTKKGGISVIPAEIFESYGTIRFINIFPLIIKALMIGGVLVVDEFDASIHPMALMSIINVFHNDDINIHNAQIIFNTHNPIFLNPNIFRRDEIKFVEMNDESKSSELYSLSDFGTSSKNGVRQHEDYIKNYFIGKYGAIKTVDFTPIFEEIIASKVFQ